MRSSASGSGASSGSQRLRAGVAIVTGAASGMGAATAVALVRTGYAVAMLDRDVEGASRVARAATDQLNDVAMMAYQCDVASEAQMRSAVSSVLADLGNPIALVNAAGILRPTRFLEMEIKEWEETIRVNLTGSAICARVVAPLMVDAGWGRIVNFSSTAGKSVSTLGGAHYTASKAGVLGLTRALAKELGPLGITVNAVCPGLIDTPMVREMIPEDARDAFATSFPIRRLGTAEEVAAAVCFLLSVDAGYINGASIDINGGDLLV